MTVEVKTVVSEGKIHRMRPVIVLLMWLLAAVPFSSPAAMAQGAGAPTRSIREWAKCGGADSAVEVQKAFAAARNKAFTLVVDCPVALHIGSDIRRPIFIDNGTSVEFTSDGRFIVDDVLEPAFVIANSSDIRLEGWQVEYRGGLPVDSNVGGYKDNGVFVAKPGGYAQPAFGFNDVALTGWLQANRGIKFEGASSRWAGPTDTSALFYILGSTSNVDISNGRFFVPANAKGSQFIPVVFALLPGYKDNQTVTRASVQDASTLAVPTRLNFSNIKLDGYYMGWQGNLQSSKFTQVRAYRYSDLEDDNGGNVGGKNKWFAPPHLFYLNYDPKRRDLANERLAISDVIDYGQRVGVARDTPESKGSGYANSLKIGAYDSTVDNYTSYRPDGLLDLLQSGNLTLSNIQGTYDSSFLHELYPGVRFPGPPFNNIVIKNLTLTDKAAQTSELPFGGSGAAANSGIVMRNVRVKVNRWVAPVPQQATGDAAAARATVRGMAALATQAGAGQAARPLKSICPRFTGTDAGQDLQFEAAGQTVACPNQ